LLDFLGFQVWLIEKRRADDWIEKSMKIDEGQKEAGGRDSYHNQPKNFLSPFSWTLKSKLKIIANLCDRKSELNTKSRKICVRIRKESMKGFSVWMVGWAIRFDYPRKYFMEKKKLHLSESSHSELSSKPKIDTFFLSLSKTNKTSVSISINFSRQKQENCENSRKNF
jgi:hypothetical protein